jgi:transcription elongation factor GreB
MTRYRAPAPKSSAYITPAGFAVLQAEQLALWQRRAEVTAALSAAAAEGDRSENAEYIYRKKELREIDRRIRYLQKRLPDLTVVAAQATDRSRVYFGAWVCLEDEAGVQTTYRIVGPDEFDLAKGWISLDSPLARALLKKTVDDEARVETPGGLAVYYVIEVSYEPPTAQG